MSSSSYIGYSPSVRVARPKPTEWTQINFDDHAQYNQILDLRDPRAATHDSEKAPRRSAKHHFSSRRAKRKQLAELRTKIGLEADAPIVEGHEEHEHLGWSSIRVILREPFAEFFGTFILVLFGDASIAQVLLSTGKNAPGGTGFGPYQSINWG